MKFDSNETLQHANRPLNSWWKCYFSNEFRAISFDVYSFRKTRMRVRETIIIDSSIYAKLVVPVRTLNRFVSAVCTESKSNSFNATFLFVVCGEWMFCCPFYFLRSSFYNRISRACVCVACAYVRALAKVTAICFAPIRFFFYFNFKTQRLLFIASPFGWTNEEKKP